MLCSKCGKNEANVYMRRTINGETTEVALCSECAKSDHEVQKMMKGTLSDDYNLFSGLFGFPQMRALGAEREHCPLCGATFEDIASEGKVGCGSCYDTFRGQLADSIARLHGNVRHTGRTPSRFRAKNEKADRLKQLREEQKEAVKTENFERAAKLRDEIRTLEDNEHNEHEEA